MKLLLKFGNLSRFQKKNQKALNEALAISIENNYFYLSKCLFKAGANPNF